MFNENESYSNAVSKTNYDVNTIVYEYSNIDTAVSKKKPENYTENEQLQYNDYFSFINNNEHNTKQLEV